MSEKPMSAAQMEAECERFNAAFPVGSTIKVHPGATTEQSVDVQVVKPGAYVMSGHTAVVQVSGGHGCIALTHVRGETSDG
jgi:hypothetical protein